jgi:hypothetical protein
MARADLSPDRVDRPLLRAGLVTLSRPAFDEHCAAAAGDEPVAAWRVRELIREIDGQSLSRAAIMHDTITRLRRLLAAGH